MIATTQRRPAVERLRLQAEHLGTQAKRLDSRLAFVSDFPAHERVAIGSGVRNSLAASERLRSDAATAARLAGGIMGMQIFEPAAATEPATQAVQELCSSLRECVFAVRAVQDNLYRGALFLATGAAAGRSGMTSVTKTEANPVGALLGSARGDYVDWFGKWRWLRNQLKDNPAMMYVGSTQGDTGNCGVSIATSVFGRGVTAFGEVPPAAVKQMGHLTSGSIMSFNPKATRVSDVADALFWTRTVVIALNNRAGAVLKAQRGS